MPNVSQTPEILLFFGRFHPLLVHLPIGMLIVLLAVEAVAKIPRFRTVAHASRLILGLAVLSAAVSAGTGWMLATGGDYDPDLLRWHRWMGVSVAAATLVTFIFHCFNRWKIYHVMLFMTCLLLTGASHYGGSLTHGRTYLTEHVPSFIIEHMPSFFRKWLGFDTGIHIPGPPPTDPEQAVLFTDLVQPILEQKCISCHNSDKLKGGLRVDTLAGMFKGGKTSGPAVIPGKATDSPLIKRMLLPLEDDKHMPLNGKPQLTDDEVTIMQWWIDSGASASKKVADLNPSVRVLAVLDSMFGHGDEEVPEPKPLEEVLPIAQQLSEDLGITIVPIAQNEPWLRCNASGKKTFGDAELLRLRQLKANMRSLNLAGTNVTDAGIGQIAGMRNLTQLHLEKTAITDAGLKSLTKLRDLEYLNLYGTSVTDAGLQSIRRLAKLQRLYLWQTKVSPEAAKKLADEFVDKQKIERWHQEIENLEIKIKGGRSLDINIGSPRRAKTSAPKPRGATGAQPSSTKGGAKPALSSDHPQSPVQKSAASAGK